MDQYGGTLNANQAAAAMQAARVNALDLIASAEALYEQERFQHSVALSILAIEEIGKLPILQTIFLANPTDLKRLWKVYRQHRAKTKTLPVALESRIHASFPEIGAEEAKEIAQDGPTPADLDFQKQLAFYSDFLVMENEPVCHLPRNADWHWAAWERLCEAKAIIESVRDRTPEELAVWLRHAKKPENKEKTLKEILPAIHDDLVAEGHIDQGSWKYILEHIAGDVGD